MALSPPCALIGGPVRRSLVHCDQIADGPLTSARIGAAVGAPDGFAIHICKTVFAGDDHRADRLGLIRRQLPSSNFSYCSRL